MKKIYILALAIGAFTFSANAQVDQTDDLEAYAAGPISSQADTWKTWSGVDGTAEDGVVSADQANSGSQSVKIVQDNDQLYVLESQPDNGTYTVGFQFYVPSGKEGYFNLQGDTPPTSQGNGSFVTPNIYFNKDNTNPGVGEMIASDGSTVISTWTFDHDAWVSVQLYVDLDNQVFEMVVAGSEAVPAGTPFSDPAAPYLGAIDFFGGSAFSTFYVDDVLTGYGRLSVDELTAKSFSVYPNPVKDVLNIQSKESVDNVTVYDILGKVVLQENPGKISPAVNMSSLASGSYLVKVTIGNTSKTVKVLK